MAAIDLEIVTPDGIKLHESVDELTAPSVDGEFGILPQHIPMLAALTTGIVSYTKEGQTEHVAVGPGFFEFSNDHAVVLTDRFIKKADVDPVRVRLDLKEADEALDHYLGDPGTPEHAELIARELWAAAQLELYGDPAPPRVRTLSDLELNMVEDYKELASERDDDEHEHAEGEAHDHGSKPEN